jgi:hypothetical protein
MAFYFNGTLIPENVASVFKYNGVDATSVVFNGTIVWQQSLFSAIWSGSSITSGFYKTGINTSGSLFQAQGDKFSSTTYGSFYSALVDGTFESGTSTSSVGVGTNNILTFGNNTIQRRQNSVAPVGSLAYTIGSGFSSNTLSQNLGFETSGGLMRSYETYQNTFGAWISLT